MNRGRVEVTQPNGRTRTLKEEPLDPLAHTWTVGKPHARVGMQVGTQYDFGRIKIMATVDYECDQNDATVNEVGKAAFTKAVELMTEGLRLLTAEDPQ